MIETQTKDTRLILGLNIAISFGNDKYKTILENLHDLGVRKRTYDYIQDFLSERKASIQIAEHKSDLFLLWSRTTPQGSVLSPTLFNVAMIKLPPYYHTLLSRTYYHTLNHTLRGRHHTVDWGRQ